MKTTLSDLANPNQEHGSQLVHVQLSSKTLPPVEFLIPMRGTVVGDAYAGFFVEVSGHKFFCPYDRAGGLKVGDTAYFTSVYNEKGLHVAHPRNHAAIIQTALAVQRTREVTFECLCTWAQERVTVKARVVSLLRYQLSGEVLGIKVTIKNGSPHETPGFIAKANLPSATNLQELVGQEIPAVIVSVCQPTERCFGYVELSTI
jgi:hypothetical protein